MLRKGTELDRINEDDNKISIASFQSTIRKSEKALIQMTEKGANTALIKKRLDAFKIGLAVLENRWSQTSMDYSVEELDEASRILRGLLPSLEKIYRKQAEGSSQKTLLHRRIRSLNEAVFEIENLLS